jgi:hypothetical protein
MPYIQLFAVTVFLLGNGRSVCITDDLTQCQQYYRCFLAVGYLHLWHTRRSILRVSFLINGKRGLDFYPGLNVWVRLDLTGLSRFCSPSRIKTFYPSIHVIRVPFILLRCARKQKPVARHNHLAVVTGRKVRLNAYSATNPTILPFKIEQLPFISGFLPFVRLQFRLYRMNIRNILAQYIFTSSIKGDQFSKLT